MMPTSLSRPSIVAENLGKSYRIDHLARRRPSFREALTDALRAPFRAGAVGGATRETFQALQDVSFEVRPGEVIGIVGRNGAGKSTLLKILSRITEPSEGRAVVRGRLASLLEVGTGFHVELTGRENIYLNGSILGMRKAEIDRKFDEIVAFAEVERFLDTPVKYYSSGMFVRLAFAVAAHLETQILVIDEILAVGDIGFQNRCLGRIEEVTHQGRTVLFVSHNIPAVQNLCTRCLLLERGRLVLEGPPETVLAAYQESVVGRSSTESDLCAHPGRTAESRPCLTRVRVGGLGPNPQFLQMGEGIEVALQFASADPLADVFCRIYVKNNLNATVFGFDTDVTPPPVLASTMTRGRVTCRTDRLPLLPGVYSVDLYFGTRRLAFDVIHDACRFEVHPADVFGTGRIPHPTSGHIFWPCEFTVGPEEV